MGLVPIIGDDAAIKGYLYGLGNKLYMRVTILGTVGFRFVGIKS